MATKKKSAASRQATTKREPSGRKPREKLADALERIAALLDRGLMSQALQDEARKVHRQNTWRNSMRLSWKDDLEFMCAGDNALHILHSISSGYAGDDTAPHLGELATALLGDDATPQIELTDFERNIVEAIDDKTLQGPTIAQAIGVDYDGSSTRRYLSNLCKRGILKHKTGKGYSLQANVVT